MKIGQAPAIPVQPALPKPSAQARELEAVFLGMVVNEMLEASAPKTMNGGHGEAMFRSFLGSEIGAIMAETGGVGLAEQFDKSISKGAP